MVVAGYVPILRGKTGKYARPVVVVVAGYIPVLRGKCDITVDL